VLTFHVLRTRSNLSCPSHLAQLKDILKVTDYTTNIIWNCWWSHSALTCHVTSF